MGVLVPPRVPPPALRRQPIELRCLHVLLPAQLAEQTGRQLLDDIRRTPSGPTMSRYRVRVDVAAMLQERASIKRAPMLRYVLVDSSPQDHDWEVSLTWWVYTPSITLKVRQRFRCLTRLKAPIWALTQRPR